MKIKPFTLYGVISLINISPGRSEDYEPPLAVVLSKYLRKRGGFAKLNIN